MIKYVKSRIPIKIKNQLWNTYISSKRRISLQSRKMNCELPQLRSPFFIVILSGGLHILRLALKYIPDDQNIVLLFNGCENWEEKWAVSNLKFTGSISFPYRLPHHTVVNFLLKKIYQPFGLVDYDCFIFHPDYFNRIRDISSDISFSSYYGFRNNTLDTFIPETFFLWINRPIIAQIMKTYHVDASVKYWEDIPEKVKNEFIKIGINAGCLIEPNKECFDTLRVIMTLSIVENKKFFFPELFTVDETQDMFHVGGVSNINQMTNSSWSLRGTYFWNKALEHEPDQWLISKYFSKFGRRSPNEVLENYLKITNRSDNNFTNAVERILSTGF